MRPLLTLAILTFATSTLSAAEIRMTVTTDPVLPKGGEIALVSAGKPGPTLKGFEAILQTKEFGKELDLAGAGPFDVYFTPKGGLPILVIAGWKVSKGSNALKPGAHLGTVFVRGDDLPRSGGIVVTNTDDPGPGAKGHAPIQSVSDYKEDLVVPAGF